MSGQDEFFMQPKITGYRQLTAEDTALMNRAKAAGAAFEAVLFEVRKHIAAQRKMSESAEASTPEALRLQDAEPERWAAMARTDMQTAVMKLCRAIAQPKS